MARELEKVPSQNYSLYVVGLKRPFFRGDYDVASFGALDFYEICRSQLLEDYFTEKTELEYAGNACHFWFKKDAFLAEEIKVSRNKYKRPKIMYIPSERNVLSVVKNIEELDNLPLSGYKALVNKSSGETFILEEKSGRAVPLVCASSGL